MHLSHSGALSAFLNTGPGEASQIAWRRISVSSSSDNEIGLAFMLLAFLGAGIVAGGLWRILKLVTTGSML